MIRWSGHDGEGNTVTGTVPVTVTPRPVLIALAADDTDQTASLLAQLVNGATNKLPAGRFRLDRTIALNARTDLRIEGPGFVGYTDRLGSDLGIVDQNGNSTRAHWKISGGHDVTVSGVRMEGPNTGRDPDKPLFGLYRDLTAFEHAFAIQGAAVRCGYEDVTFTNVGGDGLYVGGTGATNTDCFARRVTGTYPGRQSMGIVLADGYTAEDVTIDWGGRSGLDIEPNADTHYVRGFTGRRLIMGSQFYPFTIGGVTDEIRRKDILLEDCVGRNAVSSHPAVLATRNGRNLTVRRLTDTRQRSIYGLSLNGWDGVTVEGCRVTTGKNTPVSSGVRFADCTGTASLVGNNFNGATGTEGFDQLYSVLGTVAPVVTHAGNVWAMGTKNDG